MTISGIGGLFGKNAVRRSDRGGNGMNLIIRGLMKLGYNDKKKQYVKEAENTIDDYAYELYKSLEYNIKHKNNDKIGLEKNLLNTIIR